MPVSPHTSLQHVQDRTTDLRRWLDTGDNTAALTAYLRDEPVDHRWLTTYRRLTHDLLRAVDHACPPRAPHVTPTPSDGRRPPARRPMNDDQRRALEQVRDTCAVLHTFLTTHPSDRPPERVRSATFEQLTDDLLDAVTAAQTAGVPEHRIFDSV